MPPSPRLVVSGVPKGIPAAAAGAVAAIGAAGCGGRYHRHRCGQSPSRQRQSSVPTCRRLRYYRWWLLPLPRRYSGGRSICGAGWGRRLPLHPSAVGAVSSPHAASTSGSRSITPSANRAKVRGNGRKGCRRMVVSLRVGRRLGLGSRAVVRKCRCILRTHRRLSPNCLLNLLLQCVQWPTFQSCEEYGENWMLIRSGR